VDVVDWNDERDSVVSGLSLKVAFDPAATWRLGSSTIRVDLQLQNITHVNGRAISQLWPSLT
jgi:hypothetical protein